MSTNAVAEKVNTNGQMSLLGFIDDKISGVFTPKELKNKYGLNVGTSIVMKSRKDIATDNNLKGKDNKEKLDALIEAQGLVAFQKALSELVGLPAGSFTLKTGKNRQMGDGLRQITLVAKEVKAKKGPSDEQIAKAWGVTVEEVQAMREAQVAKLQDAESKTINA